MKSLSIILVDDDRIERLKFKKVCQKFHSSTNIVEAIDGEDALEHLNSSAVFDLIISDLNMPRMNGFEFLTALRSSPKFFAIPVVIMSSSSFKNDIQRCFAMGISNYLTKPLKYADYTITVTSLLNDWHKIKIQVSKPFKSTNFN
jgi:CheY-like chemotaxis protein